MKEHEALEKIENHFINGHVIKRKELYEAIETLKSVLTPPSSDEVCEKLSEYLGRDVKINNEKSFYYSEERQYYGECDEVICGYSWEDDCIAFELDLPPHLITLIGRFYEGVGK